MACLSCVGTIPDVMDKLTMWVRGVMMAGSAILRSFVEILSCPDDDFGFSLFTMLHISFSVTGLRNMV